MRWPFPRIPKICHNLPSNYEEGLEEYNERLKERFPAGTDEIEFYEDLKRMGFKLQSGGGHRWASIQHGIVFRNVWYVRGFAMDGKIEEVSGSYGVIAP